MRVERYVQDAILRTISEIGAGGATITEIEKKVGFERHTLSKYLSFMQAHGLLFHRDIGTAKEWFINKAPLKLISQSAPERRTFIENVLTKLISSIPCGVIVIDKDYDIQFMNKVLTGYYGDVYGQKFYSAILGHENPLMINKISKTFDDGIVVSLEIPDKNGNILHIKSSNFENPDGSVSAILIIEDITKHRMLEDRLKKLSSAVEQTGDIIFITDKDGKIEYVNPSFERQTGYKKNEVIGAAPRILKSGKHKKNFYENMWKALLSGKTYRGIFINRRKNGKLYYERKTITPIRDEKKKITHFVSIGKDISTPLRTLKHIRNPKQYKKFLQSAL